MSKKYALGGGLLSPKSTPLADTDPRLIEMSLKSRIAALEAEVTRLREENEQLRNRVAELRCELKRRTHAN